MMKGGMISKVFSNGFKFFEFEKCLSDIFRF